MSGDVLGQSPPGWWPAQGGSVLGKTRGRDQRGASAARGERGWAWSPPAPPPCVLLLAHHRYPHPQSSLAGYLPPLSGFGVPALPPARAVGECHLADAGNELQGWDWENPSLEEGGEEQPPLPAGVGTVDPPPMAGSG